jgi:uncharacterized membrane protein YphA (DoxX/SURF4 family)
MSLVLWILQVVLAAMFAMAGFSKLAQPRQKLAWRLPWVEGFSPATAALIGTLELAAALALILPASTGIIPALTPLAATGLVVAMVLAATTHARRREPAAIALDAVLLTPASVAARGRLGPYPS